MSNASVISDNTPAFSHTEIRRVIIGVMLAIMLGALEQTIVAVALPMMAADLHGVDLLAWVVSAYLIAVAVATPVYSKLGDLYGRRTMLTWSILIFLAASVLCALATSMPMLVAARIVQGIGGGGLLSSAQAIVADVVSPRERGRYQGYISTAFAVASVAGPVLGGLLTQYLSWRWIFWINLPLGLVALAITRRALSRLKAPQIRRRIDYPGGFLLIAGLTPLLIAITRVGDGIAWLAPQNLPLWGASIFCLALFVWQEHRAAEPIIPLSLLGNRTVASACGMLFISFVVLIGLSVLIPMRLQILTDLGVDAAALQLLPLSLATPLGAFIGGRAMTRTGRYKPIQLWGTVLVPLSVLALAFVSVHHVLLNLTLAAMTGLGIGMQLPSATVAAQNAVPYRHMGVATGLSSFSRSLGAAIGVAVLMAILFYAIKAAAPAGLPEMTGPDMVKALMGDGASRDRSPLYPQLMEPAHLAFTTVFVCAAVIAGLGVVTAMIIPDVKLSDKVGGVAGQSPRNDG